MGAATLAKSGMNPVVVVGKAQKLLNCLDIPRWFPISNGSNLVFVLNIPSLSPQHGQGTLHVVYQTHTS